MLFRNAVWLRSWRANRGSRSKSRMTSGGWDDNHGPGWQPGAVVRAGTACPPWLAPVPMVWGYLPPSMAMVWPVIQAA